MVTIKLAGLENLKELTSLAMKLWPDNAEKDLKEQFVKHLKSKKDVIYVGTAGGSCVGFIHVSLRSDYVEGSDSSPVGYIEGIYVDEKYRNQGISRKLVQAGEQWAKTMSCSQMASDTELENESSQKFHEKVGFKEAGRIVAFIKELT